MAKVQLIQHISQLSVLLIAVAKQQPKARRIGFLWDKEIHNPTPDEKVNAPDCSAMRSGAHVLPLEKLFGLTYQRFSALDHPPIFHCSLTPHCFTQHSQTSMDATLSRPDRTAQFVGNRLILILMKEA